ncbi:MAG: hypothetical protein K8R87_00495 [Verrucomicrobia bacterium]|nr:hypothetical protein [Verrucomicrobiota bacterium]
MKPHLCIALAFGSFALIQSVAADTVRVAMITQTTKADLRTNSPDRSVGPRDMEAGQVYEASAVKGLMTGLKIDAEHTAYLSTSYLKFRECTPAELEEAKKKFNVDLGAERKVVFAAAQKGLAKAQAQGCATCPKVRAGAGATLQRVYNERSKGLKIVSQKEKAQLAEARAWMGLESTNTSSVGFVTAQRRETSAGLK